MNQLSYADLGEVIDNAIVNEEVIRFAYFKSPDVAHLRTLSPYEASADGETVLGFDHMRMELRRFELSKMQAPTTTDELYVKPIEKEDS